jgi:hypothetical protein
MVFHKISFRVEKRTREKRVGEVTEDFKASSQKPNHKIGKSNTVLAEGRWEAWNPASCILFLGIPPVSLKSSRPQNINAKPEGNIVG